MRKTILICDRCNWPIYQPDMALDKSLEKYRFKSKTVMNPHRKGSDDRVIADLCKGCIGQIGPIELSEVDEMSADEAKRFFNLSHVSYHEV